MRLCLLSLLVCSLCQAGWQTNSTIPSVTTQATLLEANTLSAPNMVTDTNGDLHVLTFYRAGDGLVVQVFDANITDGTSILTNLNGVSGAVTGSGQGAAFTNGWYYRGTSAGINGKGYAFRYHLGSGANACIRTNNQTAFYSVAIADDGKVVFGSYGELGVDRYDPSNGTWENFGRADTNYAGDSRYVYTIGADSRYIYCAVGQSPFYLAVVDTVTGVHSTYFSNELAGSHHVFRGTNGALYFSYGESTTQYALVSGVPILTNNMPWTASSFTTNYNVILSEDYFTNYSGKEFDYGFAYPDSSNNVATLRWVTVGQTEYSTTSVSNFILAPAVIRRAYPNGSGLLILSQDYLPALTYSQSGVVGLFGRTGSSLYDAVRSGGYWFLSGYVAATYRYNSGSAWNLSASTDDKTAIGVNARQLIGGWGKWHHFSTLGSDGYLYIASEHGRDSFGASLGWYDTNTLSAIDSYRPITWQYTSNKVCDLKPVGGGKLAVLAGGWPALYIFDVTNKVMLATNSAILPHLANLGKCVETSSGTLLGISGTNGWIYNVVNNTATTNVLPGIAWSGFAYYTDQRLELGPDGYVWVTLGNDLYRIHPTTCAPELVKDGVGPHNVVFNGGDAYLYNPASPALHRLENLLISNRSINATTIRANTVILR